MPLVRPSASCTTRAPNCSASVRYGCRRSISSAAMAGKLTALRITPWRQVVADGGGGLEADQLLRFGRRRRDVRRGDDLRQLGQAPVLRRLDLEHVERRAGDVARFDRVGERGLVDQLAARGVDDPHAALALRQTGRAEEVPRLGRRRNVEADVVGDLAHAVEREQLDAERGRDCLGDERVVRDDLHAERARRAPRLPGRCVRARRGRASCRAARRRSASSCPRRRASSSRRRSAPRAPATASAPARVRRR